MRVLVVDDDETFCRFLAEILEAQGMEAVWTTNGLVSYEMSLSLMSACP
jgi:DNA-binding response OmpR family regulator